MKDHIHVKVNDELYRHYYHQVIFYTKQIKKILTNFILLYFHTAIACRFVEKLVGAL
jgi:hypothetical protein